MELRTACPSVVLCRAPAFFGHSRECVLLSCGPVHIARLCAMLHQRLAHITQHLLPRLNLQVSLITVVLLKSTCNFSSDELYASIHCKTGLF